MSPRIKLKLFALLATCGVLLGVYKYAKPEFNEIEKPIDLNNVAEMQHVNGENYKYLPETPVAALPEEKITGEINMTGKRKKYNDLDICLS